MARESIEERTLTIRQKERELMEKEESYYRHKRLLEERSIDLGDRRRRLSRLLEQERKKMSLLLNRYQAHSDVASEFYREIQGLEEESEQVYRQSIQSLEEEKQEGMRQFRIEKDQLETELQRLRREEDDDTN
ncbi:hypothetical protein ACHBHL_10635 [Streptococcus sp. A27]|uniref:hypothetical protein n=1 Tax=unclassified Streptococcus TaxID=2608887 RepID=UPI00374D160A